MSIFALVDANNFYTSCEKVFNPKLEGQPVVILSNNDGCVISRSNEAKKLGIKMGVPYFKYESFFKDNNVHVLSSNYVLYGDMSNRLMKSLRLLVPDIEVYSIDEAFLKLDNFGHYDLKEYVYKIKSSIKLWIGIPVSIGIGPTKTLAKVANHYAKIFNTNIDLRDISLRNELLTKLEVKDIWGIGRNLSIALNQLNIFTAYELKNTDPKLIRQKFGVVGERIVLELQGTVCYELEDNFKPRKNLISSKSFGRPVISLMELEEAVSNYLIRGCEKMRNQESRAFSLCVFITTSRFKKGNEYYSNSKVVRFPQPLADTRVLISKALQALKCIYKKGFQYSKAGIILMDLVDKDFNQGDLFEKANYEKSDLLMSTIDKINLEEGRNTIFYAAQGIKRNWRMKTNYKSPNFTTKWEEIPCVK